MIMTKEIVSFKQACPTIDFEFELLREGKSYFPTMLVIKVIGQYRDGSTGNKDAKLIKEIMNTAFALWEPERVLLDITNLKYDWGDDIDYIFEGFDERTPFAVAVGSQCRHAISTLTYGIDTQKDIVDNVDFFDNVEKAIDKLKNQTRRSATI